MKLGFLALPTAERQTYITQAALRRGLSPVIVEKDFWVCWLLGILFQSRFADALVFKGGTSLSKVFGAIDRFSEDIDLSLDPGFLNLDTPAENASRNKTKQWMEKAEAACGEAVRETLLPELENAVTAVIGRRATPWFEFVIDEITKSPVLYFHYPTNEPTGFAYLKRSVKLEFGSLTDQKPTGRHPIVPWIAETFPSAFPDWHCEVVALQIERTFWEKATILHTEFHRPVDKPMPDRFSRHYADTAALATHKAVSGAIRQHDLRDRIVVWKGRFFGSGWARYDLAKPGTFRLVPPPDRVAGLERDYRAMRDMYLSEPPTFEKVLATLDELEKRINAA